MSTNPPLRKHSIEAEPRADGALLLTSGYELPTVANSTGDWLHRWSKEAQDRTFLAERSGPGWREVSYGEALGMVQAIGASLVARGYGPDTPVLIISGNSVDHGLLALGAQYVGVPTVTVAEQYSLIPAANGRLKHVVELVKPAMVFADDGDKYKAALELDFLDGIEAISSTPGSSATKPFSSLLTGGDLAAAQLAFDKVGPDTLAKILMTSGSTSLPKGVENTQRMMCTNQAQLAAALPLLTARPPRILDWLPWNHTFGGNHNFNMMLANGGSLYIDGGKPIKAAFGLTLENLSLIAGTLSFNVPVGFSLMLEAFKNDTVLRNKYFEDLDMIFYAGASLPQEVWKGLEEMAKEVTGAVPLLTSSWGLTETAPAATLQYEHPPSSGIIGVPLPGVTAKLIANDEDRFEIRVKGPNIMERYHRDPKQTQKAFDDEGYFITGDAVKFYNPDKMEMGLKFDGRISEDFKLLTGTWVRASALRMDLLKTLAPLAIDLIVTGADRNDIGLLLIPKHDALAELSTDIQVDNGLMASAALNAAVCKRLDAFNAENSGSSTRIARAAFMSEAPSMAEGEMTAKGNLNINKILKSRSALLERLYTDSDTHVFYPKSKT